MPRRHEYSPGRLSRVHRIMVKSDFQRRALPNAAASIPTSIIPNGVDEDLVTRVREEAAAEARAATAEAANQRHEAIDVVATGGHLPPRLLYTSSYDRGLEHILRHGWPLLHAAVPEATLHLYYGWQTHEALHPTSTWRAEMRALIASYAGSVIDHGRVGQLELLRAKATSHILYYVGHWPEIDCIAAREAAMLGCVPLTSTVAVFGDEAKDYCVRIPGDPTLPETQRAAARRAIELLREHERTGRMISVDTETLRSETWANIAAQWLQVISRDDA